MTPKKIALLVVGGIGLIVALVAGSSLVENVGAGEVVINQTVTGKLVVWKTPGPKLQMFGTPTHYKLSSAFEFENNTKTGGTDNSLKMRFNDGGHGNLGGSIRFDMPIDDEHIIEIHRKFGSQDAVVRTLIARDLEKAVYFSGPLMSSTQSFAERRNELIGFIDDQAIHGIYKSSSKCEKAPDPVTKQEKTVCTVELERDSKGMPLRVEPSPLEEYGIKLSNLSISDLDYDDDIKAQIKAQQNAIAQVQTAMANARKAEQNAITVAKEGEANAATAKWKQEELNAKLVAEAEGRKKAAELDKQAAEYTKQKDILEGEGEAAKRKLIMSADGALDKKLAAYVEVQKAYATALGNQPLVPSVVMGGNGAGMNSTNLVDMLTAKTARELGLSLTPPPAAPKK